MYSTCLFCHGALGANEVIEHFPVGRRLVFDAARGRLWVVCRSCERWNLTPLEERWEAIEECERAFAGTRLRVSTDEIGLARLREGLTLVRIGQPQRPELAAWRYGDQFGRRRRRHLITVGAVAAAGVGIAIAGPMMGLMSGGVLLQVGNNALNFGRLLRSHRTVARVDANGQMLRLNQRALHGVAVRQHAEDGFELEVPFVERLELTKRWFAGLGAGGRLGSITLRQDEALAAARVLLPRINSAGAKTSEVNAALGLLERDPVPSAAFTNLAIRKLSRNRVVKSFPLATLTPAQRLALEMCLHEDDERRALEGELAELEHRWREAEEIAAISDDLFVSNEVTARLEQLKRDDR